MRISHAMSPHTTLPCSAEIRRSMQLPPNPMTHKPNRLLGPKLVLYRGPGMLIFRFLVRMKVWALNSMRGQILSESMHTSLSGCLSRSSFVCSGFSIGRCFHCGPDALLLLLGLGMKQSEPSPSQCLSHMFSGNSLRRSPIRGNLPLRLRLPLAA